VTDETRKLLAGYATNTLTEAERKSLYEVSLNDQEVFDALHEEQALKDLLDDPVSRAQIRQALDEPHPASARHWWSRWWTWASAATAVAATVTTVAVVTREPVQKPAPPPVASVKSPAPEPPAALPTPRPQHVRPAPMQRDRKDAIALAAPAASGLASAPARPAAAAPPLPSSFSSQQQVEVLPSQQQQSQNQIPGGVVGGVVSSQDSKLEPVSYTLLKRDISGTYLPLAANSDLQPGDAVRINVVPETSGYLSLLRERGAGNWIVVSGLPVAANSNYTIPDSPIEVPDATQKFRLTLVPGPTTELEKQRAFKLKSTRVENKQSSTIVIEFTISPRSPR